MQPEERAREKIDKQLKNAGWNIVPRDEYIPYDTVAVKEALMKGNTESDYLLFVDNKAIAVLEAKREENALGDDVENQAEGYAHNPQKWYGLWFDKLIPLVYLANGNKIFFKNMLNPDSDYEEISEMHSPKKMLKLIGKLSETEYGALPYLDRRGLRDCQYEAEINLEQSLKRGLKRNLAVLATGAGKTYLACLASYRLLNYTSTKRVLFLVDRNNLARQTESEFSTFDKTERQQTMSNLYLVKRLRRESDIDADIVISTIQKLFAVLTGQQLVEGDEDAEDENANTDNDRNANEAIRLGNNLILSPDYFQFIVVDECHRSIYGEWRAVLDYFRDAIILGLTATPTPEAVAFFNNNIIENYTYERSVVDGVNVPSRIYRIATEITENGGTIEAGSKVVETSRKTGHSNTYSADNDIDYSAGDVDHSVINRDQIRKVLTAYKDAIYTELYPEREKKWEYIPKTLIFAKDDDHATRIVEIAREVFAPEFDGNVPEHFVQKITYSAGDSNVLIRDLRVEKDFRIAVTVTLVATGTDVKPLEVVLFMRDVKSEVLYTQMRGRGCRTIGDDKLREVTPNADTKECYYIVDAVGVTENEKSFQGIGSHRSQKPSLEHVLEHLSHGEVSDEFLTYLRDYCSSVHRRYENNTMFGNHLTEFVNEFGYSPRNIANRIQDAFERGILPVYVSPSGDNAARIDLIAVLLNNISARKKLIEMQKGYSLTIQDDDTVIYSGFSQETARSYIESFEKYLMDNRDFIEALRIIYNSEDTVITHNMLVELRESLLSENRQYVAEQIWKNYKVLDADGNVDELDVKQNAKALTNLIQIVRYAYRKNQRLTSLTAGYVPRFNLYCGQIQRNLTDEQVDIMRQIAEYIINDGAISANELNEFDADLWRRGIQSFTPSVLNSEMQTLARFMLRAA
ncbi:type I restriction endonuclease subunit R [Methanomicrobium mobile]|uniref:type I restriction endonuclease subunit R n=1 Tax=Methanomicrobium mobile TaxID=2205 RepID=UPI0005B2EA0B|nr:type I restriction endonuclease subunit R [Methanomicrobium mobile]